HPSRVLPSKSRIQPSFFSLLVNWFAGAENQLTSKEEQDPALLLFFTGQLVLRAGGEQARQNTQDYSSDCAHSSHTVIRSFFTSHSIVLFCRYDSTANLIATIVAAPNSALQFNVPFPRIASIKLPLWSGRVSAEK